MSTLQVDNIKQKDATGSAITLDSDGTVSINTGPLDVTSIKHANAATAAITLDSDGTVSINTGPLDVTSIKHANAATAAITLDSDGSTTIAGSTNFTGDLQVSGAVTGTDLTLSGGVYLGGTGAANYLDDYEEGTWTPDVYNSASSSTWSSKIGRYTKTGDTVHFWLSVDGGNSGTVGTGLLFTLPFTFATNGNWARIGGVAASGSINYTAIAPSASGSIARVWNGGGEHIGQVTFATISGSYKV